VRLVLKELIDGIGDTPQTVGDILVIAIKEDHLDEEGIVITEEVYEDETPEHWACQPRMRPYTVSELKHLILDDQRRRRQRHLERMAAESVMQ
jgi:hypothetical protein